MKHGDRMQPSRFWSCSAHCSFCFGSIGLARLPDFLTRLHGPTKATTLGVGAMLLASAIFFSTREDTGVSLHELAILLFLFITAPVTAHLLAKAALHRQTGTQQSDSGTPVSRQRRGKAPTSGQDIVGSRSQQQSNHKE
jgi:multicomponent K+:H+ antiporter subunit G